MGGGSKLKDECKEHFNFLWFYLRRNATVDSANLHVDCNICLQVFMVGFSRAKPSLYLYFIFCICILYFVFEVIPRMTPFSRLIWISWFEAVGGWCLWPSCTFLLNTHISMLARVFVQSIYCTFICTHVFICTSIYCTFICTRIWCLFPDYI